MDFTNEYFPAWFSWVNLFISFITLTTLIYQLHQNLPFLFKRLNQWLWCVFLLSLMWHMRVMLDSGLNMHLSGAMLITLMFGWRLAILGLALVNIAIALFNNALFINLGTAFLLNALFPVTLSYFIFLILEAKLPRHFFIYIYGSAFFGAWLVSAISALCIAFCLTSFNVFEWPILSNEYLPFFFIFGFSEAFLTAGLMTLFVVYRPAWVYSFRDNRYLDGK